MVQVHRMYVGMLVPIIQWHMMLRYDMIAPTLKHTPKFMKAVIKGCFYVLIQKLSLKLLPSHLEHGVRLVALLQQVLRFMERFRA